VRFIKTLLVLGVMFAIAGSVYAQDKTKGTIKGKVRVEVGSPNNVTVSLMQQEKELTKTSTDKGGDFSIMGVPPGVYSVKFRKPGLSIGTIDNVEVKAGKTRSLGDRLILTIDEGSIAFIRGSVFDGNGRSVPNAKIELARIQDDGSPKKIDGRLTTETGAFAFRLPPDAAKYRVTLKADGEPVTKDVEVDGAAVYRVALSLPPKP